MGCLHVKITPIENHIPPVVSFTNPIEIRVLNNTFGLIPVLTDLYENHLRVVCSLICSLNVKGYIEVSPEETQWLTEDTDITYIVKSNTDWEIITE